MKNRMGKGMRLAGMLWAMSLVLCACAGGEKAVDTKEPQTEQSQPLSENPVAPKAETSGDTGEEKPVSGPPKEESLGEWQETEPDLEGDIKELKKGQITVIESMTQEDEGGGEVKIAPASGSDDSEFNKVTVTYDENTRFAVRTIYDGGARSELSKASAEDLEERQMIQVWGSFSEGVWEATQICVIKVE